MSGIFLQSTDGGEIIEVPLGVTVIGRGPFLQITDKRVSRSHAELEAGDDVLYLTPTHTNPCFLRQGGGESQVALPKGKRRILAIGDVFGLLPEQLFFTVCGKKGAVNGTSVKVKDEPQSQTDSTVRSTQKSQEKTVKEDPDAFLDDEEEDSRPKKAKTKNKKQGAVVDVPGKHKMAMPLDKKRVLPDWMIRMAAIGPVPDKKKAKPTAKIPAVAKRGAESSTPRKRGPVKRTYDEDDDDDDEEEERHPQRRRGRPSRRAAAYNDDDDDDDLTPRKRPSRAARESRGSYVDEFLVDDDSDDSVPEHLKRVKDDDSDFEIDDGGGDSGSDWENRGKGKKGKSPRGKAPTPVRRTGKRGRPRKIRDDEDDFEESDGEAYVPRPSKRRGGAGKRKKDDSEEEEDSEEEKPRTKKKGRKRKDESEEDSEEERPRTKKTAKRKKADSEEEESEEEKPRPKKTAGKRRKDESEEESEEERKTAKKNVDKRRKKEESEEEDDEEEAKPAKKKNAGKKKRKKCEFGKKCYRKNPAHFEEYCHPGDATFDEDSEEEEDDDKPECQYGTNCFRTNAQHRKEYSHKKKATRPQRKMARNDGKKSTVAGDDDDDGQPNTYDYNDSFLDDADLSSGSSSYGDPEEEDSDYDPGEEDVKSLMKEAKGFVKKKKMRQPVGKKIEITMD